MKECYSIIIEKKNLILRFFSFIFFVLISMYSIEISNICKQNHFYINSQMSPSFPETSHSIPTIRKSSTEILLINQSENFLHLELDLL